MRTQSQIANELLRERNARCNCGGPEMGTGHSPDCSLVRAAEDAWEDAGDTLDTEVAERAQVTQAERASAHRAAQDRSREAPSAYGVRR